MCIRKIAPFPQLAGQEPTAPEKRPVRTSDGPLPAAARMRKWHGHAAAHRLPSRLHGPAAPRPPLPHVEVRLPPRGPRRAPPPALRRRLPLSRPRLHRRRRRRPRPRLRRARGEPDPHRRRGSAPSASPTPPPSPAAPSSPPPARSSPPAWRWSTASPATWPAARTTPARRAAPATASSTTWPSPPRRCSTNAASRGCSSSTATCTRATAPPASSPAVPTCSRFRSTPSVTIPRARRARTSTIPLPDRLGDRAYLEVLAHALAAADGLPPRHRLLQRRRRPARPTTASAASALTDAGLRARDALVTRLGARPRPAARGRPRRRLRQRARAPRGTARHPLRGGGAAPQLDNRERTRLRPKPSSIGCWLEPAEPGGRRDRRRRRLRLRHHRPRARRRSASRPRSRMLMALAASPTVPVVRVPEGGRGLDQARARRRRRRGHGAPRRGRRRPPRRLAGFATYGPEGRRGEGAGVARAAGWGRDAAAYRSRWRERGGLILQIESPEGLAAARRDRRRPRRHPALLRPVRLLRLPRHRPRRPARRRRRPRGGARRPRRRPRGRHRHLPRRAASPSSPPWASPTPLDASDIALLVPALDAHLAAARRELGRGQG